MGVTERRARHKNELRQQILGAARELFVSEGYYNVSMRKIAERIEYSPTTIYLHFRDKAELLHCLTEETFGRLAQQIEQIIEDTPDPLECLKRGLCAYVEFGLRNPEDYKVAFMLEHEAHQDPVKDTQSMAFRAYSFLWTKVEDCIRRGMFRVADIQVASQYLWAVAHGVTSLLIVHPEFPWAADRELLIETSIGSALAGLRAQPPASSLPSA